MIHRHTPFTHHLFKIKGAYAVAAIPPHCPKNDLTFKMALLEIIKSLETRYCRYVDTKNWSQLAALFTRNPNLRFLNENGVALAEFSPVDEFLTVTKTYLSGAKTKHQVHNDEIELFRTRKSVLFGRWKIT